MASQGHMTSSISLPPNQIFGIGEARSASACTIYYPWKRCVLESRDLFKFSEINNNISLMVQGRDIVAVEH